MSTESLRQYVKAARAAGAGDTNAAEAHLAASVGVERITPYMKQNLGKLVDGDEAVLTVVLHEARK